MEIQVKENHYDFNKYVNKKRWNSYYQQIKETLNLYPQKVLLIGIGDGLVADLLKKQGVEVYTMDYDSSLNADYTIDITKIDELNNSFDVIICCQVLEHLPFSKFKSTIDKLLKISSNLVLSLPIQHNRMLSVFKLQKLFWGEIRFSIPKGFKEFKFDGQHYWELNTKGYSKKSVQKILQGNYNVLKSYTLTENTYHHFFVIQNR